MKKHVCGFPLFSGDCGCFFRFFKQNRGYVRKNRNKIVRWALIILSKYVSIFKSERPLAHILCVCVRKWARVLPEPTCKKGGRNDIRRAESQCYEEICSVSS